MRILKKLMTILMMIVILFSMNGIFLRETKAATYLIKEADLYSKGEMVSFRYKDINIGVQFVVYKKDGVEYPAYCLNRNLIGVTTEEGAKVTVNKALEDVKIWRVITNGYPFKSPTELRCNSSMEAFAATKMAVYDTMYHYNWADFKAINEQGERVIKAAENIAKIAGNSKATKISGKVEIKEITEGWEQDEINKEYISKTYEVETNTESTEYTIQVGGLQIDGFKITDKNNKEKTQFDNGELFKILIPTEKIESKWNINREFYITATANLKTKPILYGETEKSDYQNYALVAGEWEFEKGYLTDSYPPNKTTIKVIKEDAETGKSLECAKFNVLDENKNIVYTDVTTNENGVAELVGIMPGKYFIEEIQAPEGYTKYEEIIEIDVGFNETYEIKVNNYQKPKEEKKEVEDKKEIVVTSKKEKLLPRTGF